MKPEHLATRDRKIDDGSSSTALDASVVARVEDAAQDVGKPASEPVERTAELLNAELEVSKAGIAAPEDAELPVPR